MASDYTLEEKMEILKNREISKKTIVELCAEYNINVPTYYVWKKEVEAAKSVSKDANIDKGVTIKDKYNNLKKLYIGLSEHNYKLAKFLEQ